MAKKYPNDLSDATQPPRSNKRASKPIVRIRAPAPYPTPPTASDGRRFCDIRYADCYRYFDTVKYLSKTEISEADQAWLRSGRRAVHLDIREHGDWVYPKKGQPYQLNIWPYRFRIEVQVPDREALAFFAKLPHTIVTAAHVARDFTFDDGVSKNLLLQLFAECWVQRWQRTRSLITFPNGGISTGRRGKGSYWSFYSSKHCRIDGVVECFHGEGRHHGRRSLGQIGIHSPTDLIDFKFTEYWSSKDQVSLKAINRRALGRYHRNCMRGTRDQQPDSGDLRIGGLIWRLYGTNDFGDLTSEHFIRHYPRRRSAKNIIGNVDTKRHTRRSCTGSQPLSFP